MVQDKIPISIPRDLYDKIKRKVDKSQGEFQSVQEYVEFVLTEMVKEEEPKGEAYTKEEERKIKRRLKSLGYF